MQSVLKLHIQDEDGNSTIVPLVREEVTIGRQEGNTIRLTERNVSRRHGRLRQMSTGSMVFEEVSARFGTRINGTLVSGQTQISPGDVIEIGDYRLALKQQAAALDPSRANTVIDPPAPVDLHAARPTTNELNRPPESQTAMIKLDDINEILDDDDARDIPKDKRARMIILSDNVRQREIVIQRTPTVIGRTDENDVQIDHRSISRNHAKIIWSDNTYTVRDLDSANGIRVNRDFYKRSDLHSGDELELGHVVLKFLEAGDNSIPAPADLPVAQVAPSSIGRLIFVGLLAVAITITVAWFKYFSVPTQPTKSTAVSTLSESPPTPTTIESGASGVEEQKIPALKQNAGEPNLDSATEKNEPDLPATDSIASKEEELRSTGLQNAAKAAAKSKPKNNEKKSASAAAVGTAFKGEEPATPKPDPKSQAVALLKAAKADIEAARYADARKNVNSALRLSPKLAGVDRILDTIAEEEAGEKAAKKARTAVAKKRWRDVWATTNAGLSDAPNSKVSQELATLRNRAARALVGGAVARGDKALRRKRYMAAMMAYRDALEYDNRNVRAKDGLKRAKELYSGKTTAAVQTPKSSEVTAKPKATKPKITKPKTPKPKTASKLERAKVFYDQARSAKRSGRLSDATALYKKCLSTHGGMASCRADLAIVLMAQGKKCSALRHMRSYVRLRPGGSKAAQFKRLIEQFEPQCQ
jgi:pSer/pThr/pTyr-binding forkhead associated (FHA) protein